MFSTFWFLIYVHIKFELASDARVWVALKETKSKQEGEFIWLGKGLQHEIAQ